MLRRLLHGRMKAFERQFGYDMAYGHEMLDVRLPAFLRFWQAARLAQYTDGVPTAALFAARIATAMVEDCGPCAQLVVTMAEKAGVPAATLRAIVVGDSHAMDKDVQLAWRFARATLAHDAAADALRMRSSRRGVRAPSSRWHSTLLARASSRRSSTRWVTAKRVSKYASATLTCNP